MATYKIPGQNLSLDVPDENEAWIDAQQNLVFWRSGNKLYNVPVAEAGAAASGLKAKNYNMGDAMTAFGQVTRSNGAGLSSVTAKSAQTGEVITRGVSATNPNAATETSSLTGLLPSAAPKYGQPGAIDPAAGVINPNAPFNATGSTAGFTAPASPTPAGVTELPYGGGAAPKPTTIGNPVVPPTTGGATYSPPQTSSAPSVADAFTQSLSVQIENSRAMFEAENTKRTADYDKKIADMDKKQSDLESLQAVGMTDLKNTTTAETAEKRAAFDLEKQRVDDNYNANQALVNEMDGLLTTGNQVIQQMKDTTGLSSIMEPRIAKTMSDVAARAGVIQAVLAARNNQIGVAQNQLTSSLNAIESIYNDQIDYYKTLQDFYSNQKTENSAILKTLNSEQKVYLDMKLTTLADDLKRVQDTADIVSKAMTDPDLALAYGQAGVSLNDSPAQIAQKLAVYGYSKEVADNSNEMSKAGFSSSPISGGTPVTTTDSKGVQKTWWKAGTTAATQSWSTPYSLGGDIVQKNMVTGEIRTAVNVPKDPGETTPSANDVKVYINQQMATPAFKGMTLEQKTQFIRMNGGDPRDFGPF